MNLHFVVLMLIQAAAAHLISQLTGLGVMFDMQPEELINAALSVLTDLAQVFAPVDCITLHSVTSENRIVLITLCAVISSSQILLKHYFVNQDVLVE